MSHYYEEQSGEIEALSSIYSEELQIVSKNPQCFQVCVTASTKYENKDISVLANIQFTYTKKYPDEAPLMEVPTTENLSDSDIEDLMTVLNEEANENLGMVMVFTLVSAAQEHLIAVTEKTIQGIENEKYRIEMARRKEDEKKFHGTPVTVESFTKWKIKFEEEVGTLLKHKVREETEATKKLTGRHLFERDASLKDSDAQFYAEGGVKVDESLFQELDDLDLDEELED